MQYSHFKYKAGHICVSIAICSDNLTRIYKTSNTEISSFHILHLPSVSMGPDSSVGIATRYWLDGPGIESRWGARYSALVQTGPEAHPASYSE